MEKLLKNRRKSVETELSLEQKSSECKIVLIRVSLSSRRSTFVFETADDFGYIMTSGGSGVILKI